uniref:hypothetical protein n=1 Tax=Thaumasiovibrio occultus TaxID=1891184 RepID=UPI000B350139|nr:hypothetical protein [Thaumasiovibrio occultus]
MNVLTRSLRAVVSHRVVLAEQTCSTVLLRSLRWRVRQRRKMCVWMVRSAHWVMPMVMVFSLSLSLFV